MSLSLKQYLLISQPVENLSEEQIQEIFGLFGKPKETPAQKLERLRREREKLLKRKGKTAAEIEAEWSQLKSKIENPSAKSSNAPNKPEINRSIKPSAASIDRATDRSWAQQLASGDY